MPSRSADRAVDLRASDERRELRGQVVGRQVERSAAAGRCSRGPRPELEIRSGRARSLSRYSPRSRSRCPSPAPSEAPRVASETRTWPPWAAARCAPRDGRRARRSRRRRDLRLARVHAHPHPDVAPPRRGSASARWASRRRGARRPRWGTPRRRHRPRPERRRPPPRPRPSTTTRSRQRGPRVRDVAERQQARGALDVGEQERDVPTADAAAPAVKRLAHAAAPCTDPGDPTSPARRTPT